MNQIALDPQPQDPSYRLITLTQGQSAIVDADDYDWLNQWKWCALWCPSTASFYAARTVNKSTVYMGRVILNAKSEEIADHDNHDTLDHRRANLRLADKSQSQHNKRQRKDNTTGRKGVNFNRAHGKYYARIKLHGKEKYLGAFTSVEEAGDAYDSAAIRLHGEFACLK